MWQERIHGRSSSKYSATDPFLRSLGLEFHVTPTRAWPQCSIILLTYGGNALPRRTPSLPGGCSVPPWTSSQISTPASAAALPHARSDRPICSSVLAIGTDRGRPLGRTLTPLPPMSAASSMKRLHV